MIPSLKIYKINGLNEKICKPNTLISREIDIKLCVMSYYMPRREKENIDYTIDDPDTDHAKRPTAEEIMRHFEETPSPDISDIDGSDDDDDEGNDVTHDYHFSRIQDYDLNYNTKQLGSIYEYYKLGNSNKLKKIELAQLIVAFENDEENADLVERRQTLWFYMRELKNDPFTKKYIWAP